MSSSIAGQTLFNSGPHRFYVKPVGMLFVPPLFFDPLQTTINVIVPLQLSIIQTGRLIGTSEQDLWSQFSAIQLAAEAQLNGVLIDNNNISWLDMTLLRFASEDRVDRGRVISLAYTATYVRL
jgi:hypothetical protein